MNKELLSFFEAKNSRHSNSSKKQVCATSFPYVEVKGEDGFLHFDPLDNHCGAVGKPVASLKRTVPNYAFVTDRMDKNQSKGSGDSTSTLKAEGSNKSSAVKSDGSVFDAQNANVSHFVSDSSPHKIEPFHSNRSDSVESDSTGELSLFFDQESIDPPLLSLKSDASPKTSELWHQAANCKVSASNPALSLYLFIDEILVIESEKTVKGFESKRLDSSRKKSFYIMKVL